MGRREIGWGGMDWIQMAQDRDRWENFYYHGNEPSGSIKYWEILERLATFQGLGSMEFVCLFVI
jgi:hypothetical protein